MNCPDVVVRHAIQCGAAADAVAQASAVNGSAVERSGFGAELLFEIDRRGLRVADLKLKILADAQGRRDRHGA